MTAPTPEKVQETVAHLNAVEKMIAVPQALLGAAISAIDKKREGPMTIALLRHYVFNGDPAQASEYADAYRGAREDLAIWKRRALEAEAQLRQQPEPVADDVAPGPLYTAPVVSFYRDGIVAAADWVEKQREAYDDAHGRTDPDTNTFEFSSDARRDYSNTLAEIAEGIRALHPNADAQPARVIIADLSEEGMAELMRDLAESRPDGIIFTPRQPGQNTIRQNRDLVMMVKVLCHALKMHCPESKKAMAYMDYLKREGLISTTDILRDGAKDPE